MQQINNLLDLLIHSIQNIYSSEMQIQQAMPQILKRVQHSSLKNALTHHAELTAEQKSRLEKIPSFINKTRLAAALSTVDISFDNNYKNKGISGLIEEVNEQLSLDLSKEVVDAAVIASVQKIEHYEICAYGTAVAYARQLKLHDVENLLSESLDEEYDADDLLTALATAALNKEALPDGVGEDDASHENDEATNMSNRPAKVSISERTINSPGGRAGTSHRRYGNGESRGH